MDEVDQRRIVRAEILGMKKRFSRQDLFLKIRDKHGIKDRRLILSVLDQLCDTGAVTFSLAANSVWMFTPRPIEFPIGQS